MCVCTEKFLLISLMLLITKFPLILQFFFSVQRQIAAKRKQRRSPSTFPPEKHNSFILKEEFFNLFAGKLSYSTDFNISKYISLSHISYLFTTDT